MSVWAEIEPLLLLDPYIALFKCCAFKHPVKVEVIGWMAMGFGLNNVHIVNIGK